MLLALASGGTGAALAVHNDGHTTTVVSGTPASGSSASSPASGLAAAAATVEPSVVTIAVQTGTSSGEGSGVIIRSDGTIVTNDHVVEGAAGGAGIIKVTFSTGRTAEASIVGHDSSADIAVIRATGVSGLKPAAFGSASALHAGDTVLAIGSPLGLDGSVTSGIVSALNRTISVGTSSGQPFGQQTASSSRVTPHGRNPLLDLYFCYGTQHQERRGGPARQGTGCGDRRDADGGGRDRAQGAA